MALFEKTFLHLLLLGKIKQESSGELVGGNSSFCIVYLVRHQQLTVLIKLFIEDLDEYLYHIDRMMMNLKRNGVWKVLKELW
jgi:muramoyltetrapeptide carboxypeptidase